MINTCSFRNVLAPRRLLRLDLACWRFAVPRRRLSAISKTTDITSRIRFTNLVIQVLSLTSIDTAGLWVDRTIGAESDMSNLVAQLAALNTLGSMARTAE
jgi:hypothetical protein